ncbi:MAG: hypothetical protein JJE50_13650, partial [Actinomycetales bacterium]|nr:hypothetical protein [Actinomycetales bacterium]
MEFDDVEQSRSRPAVTAVVLLVLVVALASVKQAAAESNKELGHLETEIADAIIAACNEIRGGSLHDQFVVDQIQGGAGTSTNMNANEVIANRALEILGHGRGNYHIVHPLEHALDQHQHVEVRELRSGYGNAPHLSLRHLAIFFMADQEGVGDRAAHVDHLVEVLGLGRFQRLDADIG